MNQPGSNNQSVSSTVGVLKMHTSGNGTTHKIQIQASGSPQIIAASPTGISGHTPQVCLDHTGYNSDVDVRTQSLLTIYVVLLYPFCMVFSSPFVFLFLNVLVCMHLTILVPRLVYIDYNIRVFLRFSNFSNKSDKKKINVCDIKHPAQCHIHVKNWLSMIQKTRILQVADKNNMNCYLS